MTMMKPRYIDPLIASDQLDTKGLYIGSSVASRKTAYLSTARLTRDHVVLSGPPGCGKTMLMTHLFSVLAHDADSICVVIDPKPSAGFYTKTRDYCLLNGLTKRLSIFDLGELQDGSVHLGYDPMKPNGIPPAIHAKQVREAIRSAHGQTSFDDTRQLARFLYYGLLTARLFELTLTDAVDIMWPGSQLRKKLLPKIADPRLKAALLYVEKLSTARQDQLIASTLAMLESFVNDAYIQTMLNTRPCLDFEHVLANKRILLINLGAKNPLSWDDVRILGRLLLNDLLSHVYARTNKSTRVYLFIDECHLVLSHDLCLSLDLGRELGLTCFLAHQRLKQFEQEDPSGNMLDAVLTDCKVKMIFGGLTTRDLKILEEETRIHEFNPYRVKNIMWTLEQEMVETTRQTRSIQRSSQKGKTVSYPTSVTDTRGENESHGTSETKGVNHTKTKTRTDGTGIRRGTAFGEGENTIVAHARSRSRNRSETEGTADTDMWSDSFVESAGWANAITATDSQSLSMDYDGLVGLVPTGYHWSTGTAAGAANTRSGSQGRSRSSGGAHSRNHAISTGESAGEIDTLAHGTQTMRTVTEQHDVNHTEGESEADGTSRTRGTSSERGRSTAHAVQRGVTPGTSEVEGCAVTETTVPFHEIHQRRVPSSIEFLSRDEQALLNIQEMKALPVGRFMLAVPGTTVFMDAPWFDPPEITPKTLARALARVYPALSPPRPALPEPPRLLTTPPESEALLIPLTPEVLPPAFDDHRDDDDREFLE